MTDTRPTQEGPDSSNTMKSIAVPRLIATKLHGRAFYESLGSPRKILAPMVDQSEFVWRLLTRSFVPPSQSRDLLSYTPMIHSRIFSTEIKHRHTIFQPVKVSSDGRERPHLDGNPDFDRPLFVQFCSNSPDHLLSAARHVQDHCDAVDLNLGCPQGIAKKGNYGAFLQEDQPLIHSMIRTLHERLDIPVTAKIRVLQTKEQTLEYARMVLDAGASILTVHGRTRDQKGHKTGLADWEILRYLRDNLPPETVLFANGNILNHEDFESCLKATGADAVMSAEGNLSDPSIFTDPPPADQHPREYWRGRDGKGGWRMDAVLRRYLDMIHVHVLEAPPPTRQPLFIPSDLETLLATQTLPTPSPTEPDSASPSADEGPPAKRPKFEVPQPTTLAGTPSHTPGAEDQRLTPKQQTKRGRKVEIKDPNLIAMKPHFFHVLRHLVNRHHDVRDALARCRTGDIPAYEAVLAMVEDRTRDGLLAYERGEDDGFDSGSVQGSVAAAGRVEAVRRPWFVCQPNVRPSVEQAAEKGAITLGKRERRTSDVREQTKVEQT